MCIDLNIYVVHTHVWRRPRQYTQDTPIIPHQRGLPKVTACNFWDLVLSPRGEGGGARRQDGRPDFSSNATWTSLSLYSGFNPKVCFSLRSLFFPPCSVYSALLKREVAGSSGTFVFIYQTTRCHIILDLLCCGKSNLSFMYRFLLCTVRASDMLRTTLI
jgi:hypothetical protein